ANAAALGGGALGVPLDAVQLYESAVCLVLFGFLVWLGRRAHRDGDVIAAYTLIYAIARFGLEFFRGDADRGFVFGGLLSTSQFIAIPLAVAAIVVLLTRSRRPMVPQPGARRGVSGDGSRRPQGAR